MTHKREKLPPRHPCETFKFECQGLTYLASIGWFCDGSLAEIFITNHKAGSAADCNARDGAVVCSIALQYGAPLDVIRKALMRNSRGDASGPLGAALDIIANSEQSVT
jgi:ribonucleoside-diphosphate reductase alpha chain